MKNALQRLKHPQSTLMHNLFTDNRFMHDNPPNTKGMMKHDQKAISDNPEELQAINSILVGVSKLILL